MVYVIGPLLGGLGISNYVNASPTLSAILTAAVTLLGYFGIHAAAGNVKTAA